MGLSEKTGVFKIDKEALKQENDFFYQLLGELAVHISTDRLNFLTNRKDVVARERREGDSEFKFRWTFNVSFSFSSIYIHLGCFFSMDSGLDIIQYDPDRSMGKINLGSSDSFFGEFCNLVRHGLQNALETQFSCLRVKPAQDSNVQELPTRELVKNPRNLIQGQGAFGKFWVLECNNNPIVCHFYIHVPNEKMKEIRHEIIEKNVNSLILEDEDHVEHL